jgi:DNA sulfur modification protein DndD
MSAIMRILGWRAEGLRCPDHEIDCRDSNGEPYGISLIQMPNGTGKTTTLTLLRLALSGSAADGSSNGSAIRELQKRGSNSSDGEFVVRLLLNEQRVTIIMRFDFESLKVHYKTTRGSGQFDGFDPPFEFRRFMNIDFVNFFVFDGELAQHLLDPQQLHAEAIVESLFQINSLQTLERKVAEYWERKTRNMTATEDKGLTRRQNRLDKLRARLNDLKKERKILEDKRTEVAAQLRRQQEAYDNEIRREEARGHRLSGVESDVKQLEADVREEALDVLDCMRDPHALSSIFAKEMRELKMGLDRVKLPESAAREFFEELAAEPECVCGRPIDDDIRSLIRTRAHQYLGSDDVSLLNSMKTAIQEAVGHSDEESERILVEKIRHLEELVSEGRQASNELDQLRLEAELSDPAVMRAKELIQELQEQLSRTDRELERFESKDSEQQDERTFGVDVIQKRITDAEAKLAEVAQTIELKNKRDILTEIIRNAHTSARNGVMSEVCVEANNRILQLMPHSDIAIDRIERRLILKGQDGGSAGETLSVAYAFLATLFHRSEHQLPFVVDSPAGPIDLAVRPKIGDLVPKLTSQFIAFTISSEREGFVPRIRQASKEVQFITVFRKGSSRLESAARSAADHAETLDGLVVPGESFFNRFQLDAEEVQ